LLVEGEKALSIKDYAQAEKHFTDAVQFDPKNYKALRSLAEVKVKLSKFKEANGFLDRILALPATTGRDIIVYLPGDTKPHEAEIVDETVMALDDSPDSEKPNKPKSKFLKEAPREPVPHYRVYLKDTGKMKLTPKSKTRVAYKGIPTSTREETQFFKSEVQKMIIDSDGGEVDDAMISIPSGCFKMGSEKGNPNELPVHDVCISAFKLAKYEVSQKNFQSVMGFNPSQNIVSNHPVDSVSWLDARNYCRKRGLRLPTEAEWEYAARAGTQTEYYWGENLQEKMENFCDSMCEYNNRNPDYTDGFKNTAPIGSFPPNPFGLHDMAGNLSEWVQDWMDIDTNYFMMGPKQDPPGPRPDLDACMGVSCAGSFSITQKVFRSGSWNKQARTMRSAHRGDAHFQLRPDGVGFRCASNGDASNKTK
jgi:formylglycine-generating enzyme required for sulfatase activity